MQCWLCKEEKPATDFYPRYRQCKRCLLVKEKARYDARPEHYKAKVARARLNPKYKKQISEANTRWRNDNYDLVRLKNSGRRAREKFATPAWANRDAMVAIYAQARELTEATGVKHHVDHIVPLIAELVCGLHSEHNLQVLKAYDNLAKGNRLWPDMPN